MYRRYPLGVLVAVLVYGATFLAEPRGTASFTWEAFQAVGEFGGTLVSELTDDNESEAG